LVFAYSVGSGGDCPDWGIFPGEALRLGAACPGCRLGWLVHTYHKTLSLQAVRLVKFGVHKQFHLGYRDDSANNQHITAFIQMARKQETA
jgi:hypothetical protein